MGKIVITGTGRCGTSFLMHLFTALGFNTGYTLYECEQHLAQSGCNGGIEHSTGTERFEKADIVKNPEWFYNPKILDFDIDYLIVPVRKLKDVALSRESIGMGKYGGFWQGALNAEDQMIIDAIGFYKFMEFVIEKDLKVIFLDFPRITKDADYIFNKVIHLLFLLSYKNPDFIVDDHKKYFKDVFNQIANPEKVHI